jgi:hypothetical protein
MDIFTTTPAVEITTTTIYMVAALSVGGTCALIIALIVKELRSASQTEEQRPSLMAIINRIKVNGSLTIALMYLLITLSLVVSMMMAKAL